MDIYFKKISSRFVFYTNSAILKKRYLRGELVEWSKAPHWKCGVLQGTEGSNPSLSAIFFAKKWRNEAARLHFTVPSGTTSLKTEGFLHIFTKFQKPCLWSRSLWSLVKTFRLRSTCEVCSLTRVRMVFLFLKRTLRCLNGGVAALIFPFAMLY